MKNNKTVLIMIMILMLSMFNFVMVEQVDALLWHNPVDGIFTVGCGVQSDNQTNCTYEPACKKNLTLINPVPNTINFTGSEISCLPNNDTEVVFASLDDHRLYMVIENGTFDNFWFYPEGGRGGTLVTITPDVDYFVYVNEVCTLTVPFENFSLYRDVGVTSEKNNLSFTAQYNHSENVTVKLPISSNVQGIINVTNDITSELATEVNGTDELINNTYWYDSAYRFVHIRTDNITLGDSIAWTVNCTYGANFNIVMPDYLEVGDYFFASGLITDADDVPIDGLIAKTRILYQNGTDAILPSHRWNCTDGNYQCIIPTSSLIPGIYSVSIEFTDTDSGVTFKEGGTLYLSVDPGDDIHISTFLHFTFYNNNTGIGIRSESFKIYASDDTIINNADRIYVDYYNVYTGQTIYYRVDDYFDNQIYPTSGIYETLEITSTNQFEDIPIDWYSFSVKNMNHSIVRFNMTNDSRTYSQYLFPYEPFYWNILGGEYTINLTYINTADDSIVDYHQENITVNDDGYYWIRGYDLQDIILEIQFTNTTINDFEISITADIDFVNSTVGSITTDIRADISLMESNITDLNYLLWNTINLTESIAEHLNTTVWLNLSIIESKIDDITANVSIDYDIINSSIDALNTSIHTRISLIETNLTNLNYLIWSSINTTDSIVDFINTTIWTNLSVLDSVVDNINNNIWTNFSLLDSAIGNISTNVTIDYDIINNSIDSLNASIHSKITIVEGNITSIQNQIWADIETLNNRSLVMINFFNTNDGLGLPWEILKVYVNDDRLSENTFWCENGTIFNLTVKDYYNLTMYTNNFTINASFTSLNLGLTFHSWLFGNKNDDYYMLSFLKEGASRWYERGIVPYGEREFLLPSGNYTMRIYDKNNVDIHNSSYIMNNSKVYVIHGTNLSEIIDGQSVIRGQLLELSYEIDYALTPDEQIWSYNPCIIFSCFDKYGMMLGNDVWHICPALNVIATTRNSTYGANYTSYTLIPNNGTVRNGTITVEEDVLYFSGTANWVNISYAGNGTEIQNTSYIPNPLYLVGQNVTINASNDISVLRETTYNQQKKFYWDVYNSTVNPGYMQNPSRAGYHRASVTVSNVLSIPLYNVYVYAGFSNSSTPDLNTVRVTDVENGIVMETGENYKTSGDGVEWKISGGMSSLENREFKLEYYRDTSGNYVYGEGLKEILSYQKEKSLDGEFYNYFEFIWSNPYSDTFKGGIRVKLGFDLDIDRDSVKVYDFDNNDWVDDRFIDVGVESVLIMYGAVGDVGPSSSRTFSVYFQEIIVPGGNVQDWHLNTLITYAFGFPLTWFIVFITLLFIPISVGIGLIVIKRRGKPEYIFLVLLGFGLIFILWLLQAKGV